MLVIITHCSKKKSRYKFKPYSSPSSEPREAEDALRPAVSGIFERDYEGGKYKWRQLFRQVKQYKFLVADR